MKLLKRVLVGALIISTIVLGGCGKTTNVSIEEDAALPEVVASSKMTEKLNAQDKSLDKSASITEEKPKEDKEENKEELANEEIPIQSEQYATLEDLEGDNYLTKIPKGWTKGEGVAVDTSVSAYNVISNDKLNGEIVITEQTLEGADTIDMVAYMADHKKAYNEQSESTGVYVLDAGGKELDAVKIGYMKCEIKITEQMVKNAITKGSVTEEEVNMAGGMEAYIAKQNITQLQIYVPNRNNMITIATKLEGEETGKIENAAYDLANVMYLK